MRTAILGVALGVPREEMEDERHVLPAVRIICESYVTFCKTRPWVEAVAANQSAEYAVQVEESAQASAELSARGLTV